MMGIPAEGWLCQRVGVGIPEDKGCGMYTPRHGKVYPPHPLVLMTSGDHHNTYGWQADVTRIPLECFLVLFVHPPNESSDVL